MRRLKHIFLFIFLIQYAGTVSYGPSRLAPANKPKEEVVGSCYKISLLENKKEENALFKKFYKPKGREVSPPDLSKFDFSQFFVFTSFYYGGSEENSFFHLQYFPGKRGPPVA